MVDILNEEELSKAREAYRQKEKQKLVEDFEKNGRKETSYSIIEHGDSREFFYGVPVMENGKLQGFNMMKFDKIYDEIGCGFSGKHVPYTDEKGQQIFMSVDNYYNFYKELEQQDGRFGAVYHKAREEAIAENTALNHSKLGMLRNRLAKGVDKTLGTKLEEKKLAKPLKKIEKFVSDKLFGKVKD